MSLRLPILDRYMLTELGGTFGFGLAAFTLIFSATQILAIGRMVSDQHAPLWAAVEVYLWDLPYIVVLVIPMALLLGTLLAIQRLSGESEFIAMKAGGITFVRAVAPLLALGALLSFVTLVLQEVVVPFANDQVAWIENTVINSVSTFDRDLTVQAPLPGGGRQVTFATARDPHADALLNVTIVQYAADGQPTMLTFADRALFLAQQWRLENYSSYHVQDGVVTSTAKAPEMTIALGETPTDIAKRIANNDPSQMSRAQIAQIVRSGQLTAGEIAKYVTVYWQKLASPFACFVFVLIAVPFGIRSTRGGGSTGLGFSLAVAIVFVYYIVMTVCSYLAEAALPLAVFWAWVPNIVFTVIGLTRLRRAAAV